MRIRFDVNGQRGPRARVVLPAHAVVVLPVVVGPATWQREEFWKGDRWRVTGILNRGMLWSRALARQAKPGRDWTRATLFLS